MTPLKSQTASTNIFVLNIGKKLAQNVQIVDDLNYKTYLNNPVPSSIFLQPTHVSEVYNAIMSLNTYKSPGYDNISTYFVRSAAEIITFPLSVLVNQSFELGYFPSCLKTAKVVPLHKSAYKSIPTNYHPISILTCLFKILEKLIFTRLTNFLIRTLSYRPHNMDFENITRLHLLFLM